MQEINNSIASEGQKVLDFTISVISQDSTQVGKKRFIQALLNNQNNMDQETPQQTLTLQDYKNNCILRFKFNIISSAELVNHAA